MLGTALRKLVWWHWLASLLAFLGGSSYKSLICNRQRSNLGSAPREIGQNPHRATRKWRRASALSRLPPLHSLQPQRHHRALAADAFIAHSLEHLFGGAGKWKKAFTHNDNHHIERAMGTGLVEMRKVKGAKMRIPAEWFE